MSVVTRLEERVLIPGDELAGLIRQANCAGAVVSFIGIARAFSKDGRAVDRLELEHHPTLTLQSLRDISNDAAARFDVSDVRVVHRCGHIPPREPIVFAGAASSHRRAAFEAADYLMDRLKTEAVLWKKEVGAAGAQWVEPTDIDYADCQRWVE